MNSAPASLPIGSPADGETERYRLVWAGQTVSVISPSFLFYRQKRIRASPHDPESHFAAAASWFLRPALLRPAPRVRPIFLPRQGTLGLLAFFCSLFTALVLIFLGAAFTFHAGKNLVKMLGVARKLAPKLALYPAQLLQQAISAPRIIAAGVPKTPAGFSDSVDMLDTHSRLLIHDVTSYEENVRK